MSLSWEFLKGWRRTVDLLLLPSGERVVEEQQKKEKANRKSVEWESQRKNENNQTPTLQMLEGDGDSGRRSGSLGRMFDLLNPFLVLLHLQSLDGLGCS